MEGLIIAFDERIFEENHRFIGFQTVMIIKATNETNSGSTGAGQTFPKRFGSVLNLWIQCGRLEYQD